MNAMSNQVALDPGQIVERHMRELHGEFISLMSNQKNELLLRVNDLEKQIRDSSIINDYLQRQNRDVVNELDKTKNELVEHTKAADRRVVCLIDGDGTIFSLSQIAQGVPGGRSVAAKLTEAIRQYLPSDQFQLHVWLYFNKRGLSETLRRCDRRDAADGLEAFVWGFNQAAERFMMVDVGAGKEVVDAKVKAYLEDEIKASQTIKVIFSGCHDTGYLTTIRSIITGGYEQKLVLMPGYAEMAAGFYALNLPTLIIPELFEPEKFNTSTSTFPLVPPGLPTDQARPRSITTSSAGSPKMPQSYTAVVQTPATPGAYRRSSPTQRKARHIDPSKPLTKQDPPPCNLFYLTERCRAGANCIFAHDYLLKPEHLEEMRENSKKSPCTTANRGEICLFGDGCCYGHKCPNSTKCFYYKTGTCKFTGAGMHAE